MSPGTPDFPDVTVNVLKGWMDGSLPSSIHFSVLYFILGFLPNTSSFLSGPHPFEGVTILPHHGASCSCLSTCCGKFYALYLQGGLSSCSQSPSFSFLYFLSIANFSSSLRIWFSVSIASLLKVCSLMTTIITYTKKIITWKGVIKGIPREWSNMKGDDSF